MIRGEIFKFLAFYLDGLKGKNTGEYSRTLWPDIENGRQNLYKCFQTNSDRCDG